MGKSHSVTVPAAAVNAVTQLVSHFHVGVLAQTAKGPATLKGSCRKAKRSSTCCRDGKVGPSVGEWVSGIVSWDVCLAPECSRYSMVGHLGPWRLSLLVGKRECPALVAEPLSQLKPLWRKRTLPLASTSASSWHLEGPGHHQAMWGIPPFWAFPAFSFVFICFSSAILSFYWACGQVWGPLLPGYIHMATHMTTSHSRGTGFWALLALLGVTPREILSFKK